MLICWTERHTLPPTPVRHGAPSAGAARAAAGAGAGHGRQRAAGQSVQRPGQLLREETPEQRGTGSTTRG